MKFKVDENLPQEVATLLKQHGFEADSVWDEKLSGTDDDALLSRVREEGRTLITLDRDFADIRAYPPGLNNGIIVLRLKTQDKETVLAYTKRVIRMLAIRSPKAELWIVEQDRIRFRQGG